MKQHLALDEMSVEEKLAAMEALWTDLSRRAAEDILPGWHEQVLAERESRLEAGREAVLDWGEAKTRVRRELDESKDP